MHFLSKHPTLAENVASKLEKMIFAHFPSFYKENEAKLNKLENESDIFLRMAVNLNSGGHCSPPYYIITTSA